MLGFCAGDLDVDELHAGFELVAAAASSACYSALVVAGLFPSQHAQDLEVCYPDYWDAQAIREVSLIPRCPCFQKRKEPSNGHQPCQVEEIMSAFHTLGGWVVHRYCKIASHRDSTYLVRPAQRGKDRVELDVHRHWLHIVYVQRSEDTEHNQMEVVEPTELALVDMLVLADMCEMDQPPDDHGTGRHEEAHISGPEDAKGC